MNVDDALHRESVDQGLHADLVSAWSDKAEGHEIICLIYWVRSPRQRQLRFAFYSDGRAHVSGIISVTPEDGAS